MSGGTESTINERIKEMKTISSVTFSDENIVSLIFLEVISQFTLEMLLAISLKRSPQSLIWKVITVVVMGGFCSVHPMARTPSMI
jgi:hypothetical protein